MFASNAKELGVRLAKPWQKNAFFFHSPGGYPFLIRVFRLPFFFRNYERRRDARDTRYRALCAIDDSVGN